MPETNPLVSICMPTYNRASALRRGLADAQRQRYEPLEIVISDNASTDETEAVCRDAAAGDSRIRYIRQAANIGLYGNHNFLVTAARGAHLSFFHDHDEHDPEMLGRYVAFLEAHPRVGVVGAAWDLIDRDGRSLGARAYPSREVIPGLQYIDQTIRSGRSCIGIPGALIRRDALGDIRFDEGGHLGFGDFVVWFRIAETWDMGHLHERLWGWRHETTGQSARTIVSLARDYEENLGRYCDDHLRRWPQHRAEVARWRRHINRFLFWALAYELGLHYRRQDGGVLPRHGATLFELLEYRLSGQEAAQIPELMRRYQCSARQRAARSLIAGMVRRDVTWPLALASTYHTAARSLLGLR